MLRNYQAQLVSDIYAAWNAGHRNVLAVSPTGSGKTVVFSHIVQALSRVTAVIAHRSELVSQMSLTLARNGIRHRVVGNKQMVGDIQAMHVEELGRRFVDPHSDVICASVQTLVNRPEAWQAACGLWIVDEGHHLLKDNVWGRAVAMMPNAIGLAVTAAAIRADGKGLGRHADGLIDALVLGPSMRDLIAQGYLSEYRIFAPPNDLDLSGVPVGASGDYVGEKLRAAVHKSHVVGDIVEHYLRLAPGKLGLTFTVDIEDAAKTAQVFRQRGVTAEVLTGDSPMAHRNRVMRAFRRRELLQIVNCDLLGEGTDVPAVEVVSMGRPTASLQLFRQQFGRVLRPFEGKPHGIVIDHVNNTRKHGLPDAHIEWSLDRRERRGNGVSDAIPTTTCPLCAAVYERVYSSCPFCAYKPTPQGRNMPQFVDGELAELDADTLRKMRGEVERVDGGVFVPRDLQGTPAERAIINKHLERQAAQKELREAIAIYGGWRTALGEPISVQQRRFFHTFGVDVMTAQALGAREAIALRERVAGFTQKAIDGAVDKG